MMQKPTTVEEGRKTKTEAAVTLYIEMRCVLFVQLIQNGSGVTGLKENAYPPAPRPLYYHL